METSMSGENSVDELDEQVLRCRAALTNNPSRDSERSDLLESLSFALWNHFERDRNHADLDECIVVERDALRLLPEDHPERHRILFSLASSLVTLFDRSGSIDDLEEAITLNRSSLDLLPPGHRHRSSSLMNLGTALQVRFNQSSSNADLEEAITLHRSSLDLRPPGHPYRSMSLMNLGNALSTRFEQSGSNADLEEAITLYHSSLDLRPPGHPERSSSLMNLGTALQVRFNQSSSNADLEEAITLSRSSLDLLPPGHPLHSSSLMNLGIALGTRFNQSGNDADLEEAVTLHRSSLDLHPPGHPLRSSSLINLGTALQVQFEQSGSNADLEEAITLYRSTLDLLPPGHPDHSMSVMNLGNALQVRFNQSGNDADLEEAITLYRSSLDLLPPGHPYRSMSLMNLGNALSTRFEQSGSNADLEEAITLYHSSLDLRPSGHPHRSMSLINLGVVLWDQFEHGRDTKDLEEAIVSFQHGADHDFSPSYVRLRAATSWARMARENDHPTCLDAYGSAVSLLEASLNDAPTLEMQHDLLTGSRGFPSLAIDAASYAIEKQELCRAVEFLEQGRALLWLQMRGFRATIDDIADKNKKLASSFMDICQKLEALSMNSSSKSASTGGDAGVGLSVDSRRLDEMLRESRRLSEQRKEIIGNIRLLHGFEHFQRPIPFAKLQKAADEGPVIILNHSTYRSDALIILRDRDPILVPLSDGNPDFHDDMFHLHESLFNARRNSLSNLPICYAKILRSVLETLWKRVVSKVVGKLKEIGIPEGSRIWWCPTSFLQSLPFHAAGEWRAVDRAGRYCTHNYISSYTPSLNALIQARSSTKLPSNHNTTLLFVGQEDETLQYTGQESDAIKLGEHDEHLVGDEATPDRVLERLKSHAWVHFACHGILKPGKPFDASFKLFNDMRLTLLRIVGARLPIAELAVLAACHTAEQTERSADDEVLHLAAGMQFCGFRSVIGTMWAMLDESGPDFARTFYKYMADDGGSPEKGYKRSAWALHATTNELQMQKKVSLESWVNFVHIGA